MGAIGIGIGLLINGCVAIGPFLLVALALLLFFLKNKRDIAVIFLEFVMIVAVWLLTMLGLASNLEESSRLFENIGQVAWIPFISGWDMWKGGFSGEIPYLIQIVGNIMIFVPFGFFYRQLHGKGLKKAWLLAFFIPLGIEFIQTMFGRVGDANDIICNALGMMFGYYLNSLYQFVFHKISCGEIELRKGGQVSVYYKAVWIIFCFICVVRIITYSF